MVFEQSIEPVNFCVKPFHIMGLMWINDVLKDIPTGTLVHY